MKTLEQYNAEQQQIQELCDSLPECCLKCKHFGRAQDSNRKPSGWCQLRPPGKYTVMLETVYSLGWHMASRGSKEIESPFPGVWPWDKCGEFATKPVPPNVTDDHAAPRTA